MTVTGSPHADASAVERGRRWRYAGHAACAAIVVAGVAVTVVRPTAPPLGEVLPATTWFSPEHLARSEAFHRPRDVAVVLSTLLRVGFALALAFSPPGRRAVRWTVDRLGTRPALAAGAVAGAAMVALDAVLFPIAFWSGYLHDGQWGFRTQGLGGWLADWARLRAPGWFGVAGVTALGYAVAARLPRAWPPTLGLLGSALVVALVALGPLLLEPLRVSTEPLPAGATRDAVTAVVVAADVDVDEIVVADASRRTTRQNAYVSGLGPTRRVVLYDTLVAERSPEEVAAVMAHELGHHLHRDIGRGTLGGAAAAVAAVYALAALVRWRTRRGWQRSDADPRAVGVVVAVVVLAAVVTTPVESAATRRMEAAADWRALQLLDDPAGYQAVKQGLAKANLSRPDPPLWRHWWWGSHPTPAQRLTMGQQAGEAPP